MILSSSIAVGFLKAARGKLFICRIYIWSFIPMLGYLLAKLLKANGNLNKYCLFAFGAGVGLIENGFYFFV